MIFEYLQAFFEYLKDLWRSAPLGPGVAKVSLRPPALPAPAPEFDRRPYVELRKRQSIMVGINGRQFRCICDTGTNIALLKHATARELGLLGLIQEYRSETISFLRQEATLGVLPPLLFQLSKEIKVWVSFEVYPKGFERTSNLIPNSVFERYGCF